MGLCFLLSRGLASFRAQGLRHDILHLEGNSDKKKQESLESSDFLFRYTNLLIKDTISSGLAALSVPAQSAEACISTTVVQEK